MAKVSQWVALLPFSVDADTVNYWNPEVIEKINEALGAKFVDATFVPEATHDSSAGYYAGRSIIIKSNETPSRVFICTDDTPGAATWQEIAIAGVVPSHNHDTSEITTGLLALVRGGTGADLSAAGPGIVVQDSLGGSLSVRNLTISDIVSGVLSLTLGGTGADLSATGPGFVRQTTTGSTLTVSPISPADLPQASVSETGAIEISTDSEAQVGTDTQRAITPANLKSVTDNYTPDSQYIDQSSGVASSGRKIKLDSGGHIDVSMLNPDDITAILEAILTTKGDVLVRTATGITKLPIGGQAQVLSVDLAEASGLKYIAQVTSGSGIPVSTMDAKGDLLVGTADDTVARKGVGADGDALVADSGDPTGVSWQPVILRSLVDAKGDLIVGTASDTATRLAVGADRAALVADSTQPGGLGWQEHVPTTTNLFTASLFAHGTQSIPANTQTKLYFTNNSGVSVGNTDDFDNALFRHVPTRAGLYQYQASVNILALNDGVTVEVFLVVNGIVLARNLYTMFASSPTYNIIKVGRLVRMNGASDYAEIHVEHDDTGNQGAVWADGVTFNGEIESKSTYFQGFFVAD